MQNCFVEFYRTLLLQRLSLILCLSSRLYHELFSNLVETAILEIMSWNEHDVFFGFAYRISLVDFDAFGKCCVFWKYVFFGLGMGESVVFSNRSILCCCTIVKLSICSTSGVPELSSRRTKFDHVKMPGGQQFLPTSLL